MNYDYKGVVSILIGGFLTWYTQNPLTPIIIVSVYSALWLIIDGIEGLRKEKKS